MIINQLFLLQYFCRLWSCFTAGDGRWRGAVIKQSISDDNDDRIQRIAFHSEHRATNAGEECHILSPFCLDDTQDLTDRKFILQAHLILFFAEFSICRNQQSSLFSVDLFTE